MNNNKKPKEQIKVEAKELFYRYGPKTVSMDDIAKISGVSKTTVYYFFHNKNALVNEVVNDLIQSHAKLFGTIRVEAKDAIDEVLKQDSGLPFICKNLRLRFFVDLEKFYPEVWKEVEQYKLKVYATITDNLRRGKEEELYRADINLAFNSGLRLEQLVNILKPELADQFTSFYLNSVATEKGRDLLGKYLKSENGTTGLKIGKREN